MERIMLLNREECRKKVLGCWMAILAFALLRGCGGSALAQPFTADTPLVRHLRMNATYVRETKDQAWHIRVTGVAP